MNKKLFSVLVILMSLSLIGIIFVQAYYINYSLETKEDQFAFNVKKVLSFASSEVADIEYSKYVIALNALIARGQEPDTSAIRSIRVYKQNKDADQIIVLGNGTIAEQGKHQQLLDLNGQYARLWQIQVNKQDQT